MKPIHQNRLHRQAGATLLVGMIMLIVLTLLVVFAIRSSNTGLQIAGNVQAQVEATGAAQLAIETVIEQIRPVEVNPAALLAQTVNLQVGDKLFPVAVKALECVMERDLTQGELTKYLDPTTGKPRPEDQNCMSEPDPDGNYTSLCKAQSWNIEATVTDANSGASVSLVQGVSMRVPSLGVVGSGQCPP